METPNTNLPARYHPVHVVFHWLIAFMIIFALLYGRFVVEPVFNNMPEKIGLLSFHAVWGGVLALLLVARLIVRFALKHPAPAATGDASLNMVARVIHFLLYLGVAGMVLSGFWMATQHNLLAELLSQASLPEDFSGFPDHEHPAETDGHVAHEESEGFFSFPHHGHAFIANTMLLLVTLHIGAALYHQFIIKDNLIARMWFGKR